MRTAQSEAVTRLKAARLTVKATEARLRAAKTAKDHDELSGILDRALRAQRSAERDVAVERAGADFRERLRLATKELEADHG